MRVASEAGASRNLSGKATNQELADAAKASCLKSKTLPRQHTQLRWALLGEAARKNTEGMRLAKCEG
jgi:hypothetical protein